MVEKWCVCLVGVWTPEGNLLCVANSGQKLVYFGNACLIFFVIARLVPLQCVPALDENAKANIFELRLVQDDIATNRTMEIRGGSLILSIERWDRVMLFLVVVGSNCRAIGVRNSGECSSSKTTKSNDAK
jgi:hypothetical protein